MPTPAYLEELPPHDTDAEEALIAALMVTRDHNAEAQVYDMLVPSDFFREKNGWVYAAARELWHAGDPVNQMTVAHALSERDRLEATGGQTYLAEVIDRLPTSIGFEFYAHIIRRKAAYRRLIHAAFAMKELAYRAPTDDLDSVFERAEQMLFAARGDREAGMRGARSAREIIDDGLGDRIVRFLEGESDVMVSGVATGWTWLDSVIRGYRRGYVHVVGADTSIGKSQLVIDSSARILINGGTILAFTTEMKRDEWLERLVYRYAGLDRDTVTSRPPSLDEKDRISNAFFKWGHGAPCWLDDRESPTIEYIRGEVKRRVMAGPLDLVIVDHMDRIQVYRRQGDNVAEGVKAVMLGLAGIARDFDVPVIAVSHVNREGQEAADDARPLTFRHLKDGSAKEQDADVVIMLQPGPNHEGNFMSRAELDQYRLENDGAAPVMVRVLKNRGGRLGDNRFIFRWDRGGRFEPATREGVHHD